jgi:hypothetical protein
MNSTSYQPSPRLSIALKSCHPERNLAESGANRQTQSKDPYQRDTARGNERTFRIVVRFFDEYEAEHRPLPSREAAGWESPARQCRVCAVDGPKPERMAQLHESSRTTQ